MITFILFFYKCFDILEREHIGSVFKLKRIFEKKKKGFIWQLLSKIVLKNSLKVVYVI